MRKILLLSSYVVVFMLGGLAGHKYYAHQVQSEFAAIMAKAKQQNERFFR